MQRLNLKIFSAFSTFQIFTFLTAILLFGAACRQPASNISAEQGKNKKTMEYFLDHAAFNVPSALQDITVYTYGKPDKSQQVEIIGSEREASLDALAEEITDQATDGLGLNLAEKRDTRIDDMPARILTFTGEERGAAFRQFFVLAIVPPSPESRVRHLEMKYLTKEDEKTSNAKLEMMIKSARRSYKPSPPESSDNFTRRFAGAITLDIPADLRGGGFQFTLRDEGSIITDESVTFEVFEIQKNDDQKQSNQYQSPDKQKNAKQAGGTQMEEDVNSDLNSGGEILDRSTKDASTAEFKGTILSYAVNNAPPWEKQPKNKLVRRAYLQLSDAVEVRVVGRADSRKQAILEQNFNQIVNSVRKK